MKHMNNLKGFSKEQLMEIIELAIEIKKNPKKYHSKLKNKSMAMWFEKPSLRTRVSFETAMTQLGGHAIYLNTKNTHAKKAKIHDEIKCLGKYVDIIIARVYQNQTIEQMKQVAEVPVINALCNLFHPCQAMADMMTFIEIVGKEGTLAYVGDGNNVCNSLIIAAKKLGIKIHVSSPQSLKPMFEPDMWSENPEKVVKQADAVYTDTWISMGNEKDETELIEKLKRYQVNKNLISNKWFMHCLPAIRGNEVTDEVIDSDKSLVFQQAENRLHVQKAIILWLLK